MLTVPDIEPYIERAFAIRLEPRGFRMTGKRRWVRSVKAPMREIFSIEALKGGRYSPSWGISCGYVPVLRGRQFRRQSTERNAVADLIIDPIDVTGHVDPHTFSFITGADTRVPIEQIEMCGSHFVPMAFADFDRVNALSDFCDLFEERSVLKYMRFTFYMYVRHCLSRGFVEILRGRSGEGRRQIQVFCADNNVHFDDPVLSACIRAAEEVAVTQSG